MKKVLIVQDNLKMGGIQKALSNALCLAPQNEYDITLLLFHEGGVLLDEIPSSISVITAGKGYSILGKSKEEIQRNKGQFLLKGFLYVWTKLFNRNSAMRLLGLFKRKLCGYDYAVSYSHPFHEKVLSGGAAEFILSKVEAKEKICFIHCDYFQSGIRSKYNDKMLGKFDKLVCVSNSVKNRFIESVPHLAQRAVTIRNSVLKEDIVKLSFIETYCYDSSFINLLTVARLSQEKGIARALEALALSKRKDVRYYIVGEGPEREKIENIIRLLRLEEQVFLMGATENPYAYMKNADYLLVPSYHEAAPMVFDEARVLELKIVSTETLSAKEMVTGEGSIVCENSTEGLTEAFLRLEKSYVKQEETQADNNSLPNRQFAELLQEEV